ncbi:phytolongin Phyl2.2-like [Juglans microcarpa x Juglans regia]|uniref:phytolongin Phyl2.2-like n=1 Tax=Juglans microcarpa x Juglans regia TaxID=2249226 RepID=UPI001B7EEDA5|nr:phytolongin Phyl2.2-like [Juglans microcarpa x Juglans regia]
MISDPNLILYACIAKETTILSQFTREPDLEHLALKCIEKTPPYHSFFSHNIRSRAYTFLIEDPFVYFAVFNEDLEQSERLWFLNHVKCAFEKVIEGGALKGINHLSFLCLQKQCDPIFYEIKASDLSLVNVSPRTESKGSRNPSLDSVNGMKMVITPLLGSKPCKALKKKKRMGGEGTGVPKGGALDDKMDVFHDVNGVYKDFTLPVQKGFANDRQKAKQIWRKHVWVVLLLDLFVCSVLFVIWLWVCRGFNCIAG